MIHYKLKIFGFELKGVALRLITKWLKFIMNHLQRIIAWWALIYWFIKIKVGNNFFIILFSLFSCVKCSAVTGVYKLWEFFYGKNINAYFRRELYHKTKETPVWFATNTQNIANFTYPHLITSSVQIISAGLFVRARVTRWSKKQSDCWVKPTILKLLYTGEVLHLYFDR